MRDATIIAIGMVCAAIIILFGYIGYQEYQKQQAINLINAWSAAMQKDLEDENRKAAIRRAERQKEAEAAQKRLAAQQAIKARQATADRSERERIQNHKKEARRLCSYWQKEPESYARTVNIDYWCNEI